MTGAAGLPRHPGEDPHTTVSRLVYQASGMVLGRSKDYLLDARLKSVLTRFELDSFVQLAQRLTAGDRKLLDAVVDRLTINESFFFRDEVPFRHLRDDVLPAILKRGQPRVWCAACAAGQEPFSVAILLHERHTRGEILATDLSPTVLDRARRGVYSDFEVGRGVSAERRSRFFEQVESGWKVRDLVRDAIRFEIRNLVKDRHSGPFDLILCRNVLIYFDDATKRSVIRSLVDALVPGGFLMLGGTETALDIDDRLERGFGGSILRRR